MGELKCWNRKRLQARARTREEEKASFPEACGGCQARERENTKQEISIATQPNSLELTLTVGGVNVDWK